MSHPVDPFAHGPMPAAPPGVHPMTPDGYSAAQPPAGQPHWDGSGWSQAPGSPIASASAPQQEYYAMAPGQHYAEAEQQVPQPEHYPTGAEHQAASGGQQYPGAEQYGSGPQVPQPEHYPTGAAVNPFERGFPRNGSLSQMLKFAALAATVLGLVIPFDSSMPYQTQIAWSIFATLAAAAQLLGAGSPGPKAQQNWWNGVLATGALSLYWLLVVVPMVTSNSGFVLTLATAAAWAGVAFSPARSWS